ncbi:hypothetical protein [Methylobacterium sp. JK268]
MTTLPQGNPLAGTLLCLAAVLAIVAGGISYLRYSYHAHDEMSRLAAIARLEAGSPLGRDRHRAGRFEPGAADRQEEMPETEYAE